jgi:hypothetical protein
LTIGVTPIKPNPTAREKFGSDDSTAWPANILDWNISSVDLSFLKNISSVDLSFLNATVARFWGTNLTAYSLFGTSKDKVKTQAHRLSELGFNLRHATLMTRNFYRIRDQNCCRIMTKLTGCRDRSLPIESSSFTSLSTDKVLLLQATL